MAKSGELNKRLLLHVKPQFRNSLDIDLKAELESIPGVKVVGAMPRSASILVDDEGEMRVREKLEEKFRIEPDLLREALD